MYPILGEPFGFKIRAFGVMVALAFFVGYWFNSREARRTGLVKEEVIGDLLMWLLICSLIGARLVYVIVQWHEFADHPINVFKIWQGGIVYYGGFIGAFVGGWLFSRRQSASFLTLADLSMPGAMLGQAIGRIGCLLVGDDYGRVANDLPWAIKFPTATEPGDLFGISIPPNSHSLLPASMQGEWLHPTQLYMMLQASIVFVILAVVARNKTRVEGRVLFLGLTLYPIGRSICELYRGDNVERGVYFGGAISTSQLISIPIFIIGVAGLIWSGRRHAAMKIAS